MSSSRYAIGLTGGIGSGKSTIADRFAARGVAVIDSDIAAHRLTASGGAAIAAIRAAFGDAYIDASGALDRSRMRDLAFSDADAKRRLETILHPMIREGCEREREAATSDYVLLVVPLLFESARRLDVQRTLVVDCDEAVQVARVMRRSGLAEDAARAIMATQSSRAARVALADDVIDNSVDQHFDALDQRVAALHENYLRAARPFTGR